MDIGIDLGTTHSVIAVKGKVGFTPGYPDGWYLQECDVTIIPSPEGDKTFPSILWADPGNPDEVLIGYEAKQKAEEGESPIMFSKRAIGTDQVLKVNTHKYTAKDVACKILGNMKNCAEKALGKPVERIVVTHPAYFNPNQIEETKDAAINAGIDMSLPEQVMMEPAAAALAYLFSVEQDPIKVMTYDLGGGTFDVTILERNEGVITMRAFDGNPLLGGYNFDRALVQWMLDKASAGGRTIPYDIENPEDRGRRARLLMIAENIKIKLSEQRSGKVPVPVRAPDVLVDDTGKTVPIQERITRDEFKALIKDELEETIACCHRALGKANIEPEDLDMILLVGGSTFGPWVEETLRENFENVDIRDFEGDSCVAAGAAIQASLLPPLSQGHGIRAALEVPKNSALSSINVAGEVTADDKTPLADELRLKLQVYLTLPDGTTLDPAEIQPGGRFLFERIDLEDDAENSFRLSIMDTSGLERLSQTFTVQCSPDAVTTPEIYNVLPKQILVQTAQGMIPLAEEGVTLPAKIEEEFILLHDEPTLTIKLFQEQEDEDPIGTITVTDIPVEKAGRGAKVKLEVEITPKNEMRGFAKVFTRGGTEVSRSTVKILFPPSPLPDLSELLTKFEDLDSDREGKTAMSQDPRERTLLKGKGGKLSQKISNLFREQEPDRQEIQQALREMNKIVHPPKDDMEPSRASFINLLEACQALIEEMAGPEAKANTNRLERIRLEGENAFMTKNRKVWARANENLSILHSKLKNVNKEDSGPQELPSTGEMKDQFMQELDQLRARLNDMRDRVESYPNYEQVFKGRCDRLDEKIDAMEKAVEKVDDNLDSSKGLGQLRKATRGIDQIPQEIKNIPIDVTKK